MTTDFYAVLDLFKEQAAEIGIAQWIVLVFGVAEVLLARANNVLLYPAGIISVTLSAYLLFDAGLYAESGLNLYYLVMSIYGWAHWSSTKGHPVRIAFANRSEWMITAVIAIGGWGILYLVLIRFTPSTVPAWDAWVSATAWAGMWLLARRRIENWILLNISNAFAIPLLFQKDLPLFGVLTLFLFVVACFGYFDWRKKYRKEHDAGSSRSSQRK